MPVPICRGVLFCVLELAISCSAQGQVVVPRVIDTAPELMPWDLRLSWELGALGRGDNKALVGPVYFSDRLLAPLFDLYGQRSPEIETDSGEAMINRGTAETRRFVPPPGELNTAGVVRAGRMSIQDGVHVLQRDGSVATNQPPLAQGDREER